MVNYKITYSLRERMANGTYRLFLMQTITLSTTENGALLKVFGTHTDINHITSVGNRKRSFIGLNGEPSFLEIDVFEDEVFENFVPFDYEIQSPSFTKRELEVIRLLAKGNSADEVSEELSGNWLQMGCPLPTFLGQGVGTTYKTHHGNSKIINTIMMDAYKKLLQILFILPMVLHAQNNLPVDMVYVQGGPYGIQAYDSVTNMTKTHLSHDIPSFYMSNTEVSVQDFKQFCKETDRRMPPKPD